MNNKIINIPNHVAIIMDGNGRWAQEKGLDRLEGHYKGVESVRCCVETASDLGVKYLTLYAFSTENWLRPKEEVDGLMELFCKTIEAELPSLIKQNIQVFFVGDRTRLRKEVLASLDRCMHATTTCTGMTLVVALNYGSRQEITTALQQIAREVAEGGLGVEDITQEMITGMLYTKQIPDPDLLIRTSGECRLSNFLLWQLAYTELYFTNTLWPDFDKDAFLDAINEYKKRSRRYGMIQAQ